jgi:hypothetical protein
VLQPAFVQWASKKSLIKHAKSKAGRDAKCRRQAFAFGEIL